VVDFATILAGLKTGAAAVNAGASAVKAGYHGWSWWNRLRMGTVAITHPMNRANISRPQFLVEGTNHKAKGKYWLVTPGTGNDLWLKTRIALRPDGQWKEQVNIGDHPGPREVFLVLAWTSDFMDAVFQSHKDRNNRLNDHVPLVLPVALPRGHFKIVQAMILQIPA
jgi:hypothetical protein